MSRFTELVVAGAVGVALAAVPVVAAAEACVVDLSAETADLDAHFRIYVGEASGGIAACLTEEGPAVASRRMPRAVALVTAHGECIDASTESTARSFDLLEIVVAGHNVTLDAEAAPLRCDDPDFVVGGPDPAALLDEVGLGEIDVLVTNLEDDSAMGIYTGPEPDGEGAEGPLGPGGGPSYTCYMDSNDIIGFYGRHNNSTTTFGLCGGYLSYSCRCSLTIPSGAYIYIYGNALQNVILSYPSIIYCTGVDYITTWYAPWTAAPRIYGYGDVDHLYGASLEHNRLYGGDGGDYLYGTSVDDVIYGEDGDDTIEAGAGPDQISGGSGDDVIDGEEGADIIYGDGDDDTIYAGGGQDTVYAGSGCDWVEGEGESDHIYGGSGDDELHGGAGYDYIYGEDGRDWLHGGPDSGFCDGGPPDLEDDTECWSWECGSGQGDCCCTSCEFATHTSCIINDW